MKIAVFIPAYNCEKQIGRVLKQFTPELQKILTHVRVVENKSTDNTLKMAQAEIQNLKFVETSVIANDHNYNLGGSIKLSLRWAMESGYDYLICLHGDDQPNIQDLLQPLLSKEHEKTSILVGARFHPKSKITGYPLVRILGNQFFNLVCSVIFRKRIYDLIAGLNVFHVKSLSSLFWKNFPNDLTFDVHLLFYCFKNSIPVTFTPITWREEDQVSNAKTLKQGFRILRLIFFYIFNPQKLFQISSPGPETMSYKIVYSSTAESKL